MWRDDKVIEASRFGLINKQTMVDSDFLVEVW